MKEYTLEETLANSELVKQALTNQKAAILKTVEGLRSYQIGVNYEGITAEISNGSGDWLARAEALQAIKEATL